MVALEEKSEDHQSSKTFPGHHEYLCQEWNLCNSWKAVTHLTEIHQLGFDISVWT